MLDDGSPTLEVGFAIDTGGSFESLAQLQSLMDSAEAKIVADASSIERATRGMVDLGGGMAQFTAFGNAATRELRNVNREKAATEKAGERLIRQLEREAASLGKTKDELRDAKVETLALTAAQQGNADLADRLLAAARNRQAAATNAAEAEQRAAAQSAAAMQAQENAVERLAQEHASLAAKVRESHAAQEADAVAAERLRMATDPLYAATSKLNAEIAESTRLYYAGATAPAEYARQQEVLAERLREVERQHSRVDNGISTVGATGRLAGHHVQNLAFQFQDLGVQMAMAAQSSNPLKMGLMALFQQGSQISGVMSQAGIGVRGLVKEIGRMALAHPVLLGLAAATTVAAGAFALFKAEVDKSGELDKFAKSLGLTKTELEQLEKDVGGFSVTMGDAFNGLWKTIADRTGVDESLVSFKSFLIEQFAQALEGAGTAIASIYGETVGTFNAIKIIWDKLAGIVSHAFASAANSAIGTMETFVNGVIGRINTFASGVNDLLGFEAFGQMATVQFQRVADSGAVELGSMRDIVRSEIDKETAHAKAAVQSFTKDLRANIVAASKERIQAGADKIIGDRTPKKDSHSKAGDSLARELEATEALIKGNYALADSYQVSDAAAFEAEIRAKATAAAIKKQADVEAYVALQLRLAVSQRAVDGAKAVAETRAQTAAQKSVNDAVAAGTITAEAAQDALRAEAQLRPLLVAQAVAEGEAKNKLGDIIARLRGEQAASNAEAARAKVLADTASGKEKLEMLRLEATLIGATNVERAKTIALLSAEQFLRNNPGASAAEAQAYAQTLVDIAAQTEANATAQDNYNASLSYARDLMSAIGDQAGVLGGILSSAFGGFGDSIGGLITTLTDLQTQQQSISDWRRDEMLKAGGDATRLAQIEVLAAKASHTAQMKATASAIAGVKSLFKEKSTAFKVMSAIEKAYAVWQAAETIASMVRDATKTASHLANSAVRTTANTAEGGSKIFAELGPWAFPVVAAMVAVLAALGAKGGGGGSGPSIPSAEDLQDKAGTGTVLGDTKAKSESIARSLELVAANTNKDLQFSNDMLKALRSIDTSIAQMAGTVARQIQVSGSMFDTSKLGLGETSKSGFLGLFGGSSTSKTLWDLGLSLNGGTLSDIIANGITGQTYQTIQKIKTKKGFLGIGGGTKTSYSTTYGAIDGEIVAAISDVLQSLRDGLVSAAGVIGLEGAQAILDGFQVSIGQISFKDMTGEEIERQLNAIFSSIGDQMAGQLLPSLKPLQLVGEGLFETFIRVAKEYEAVDIALRSIGRTFGAIGVASIAARDDLVQLFGGLEQFIEATDFFRDNFLSEAEQVAPVQAAVIAELQRLGLAGITTRDQFKAAVLGLDLTTAAGRELYSSLLAMAPAFDKVIEYQEKAQKATVDGLKQAVDQFTKLAESLKKYRDGLFATDAAQVNAYARLKAQFLTTATLAAGGDATALGGLESAGKAFLDSARNNASSREQYLRDVATVARGVDKGIFAAEETADYAQLQLDALGNAVSILAAINANTAATAAAVGATISFPTPQPIVAAPSDSELVDAAGSGTTSATTSGGSTASGDAIDQLVAQNETLIRQNAQLVDGINKMARSWDRLDGDGLLVRTDADTPLNVVSS